ncbi:hypothetical protein OZ411_41570 [Bradyrhizobium sp. Arg237L]|uniref:hypothetical protein n=1 Tax=Bradyrhizobium sp. Arg237L TaxID=3003352 RepID=UPI00249F3FA7|nr:hypothetical protein [Bradyrhizobium sp. Arg237L]MDI4239284.1 hypothetical protein [Bradyrhizobium sp. Arg237L]
MFLRLKICGSIAPDASKVRVHHACLPAAQSRIAEIRPFFARPSLRRQICRRHQSAVDARIEASTAGSDTHDVMQFERKGESLETGQSTSQKLVFERAVCLPDTFAKEYAKG